ncbi:MAG: hypothetical protein HY783_10480 [Chloroflexi bacterium]|nr:hypothetical protein [Chloroflexota bacterium]
MEMETKRNQSDQTQASQTGMPQTAAASGKNGTTAKEPPVEPGGVMQAEPTNDFLHMEHVGV